MDMEHEFQEYFLWGRSMGAVVAIFYAQLYLSPKSISQFEEKKIKGKKNKVIPRKNSVYKTQYRKDKNGKNIKQVGVFIHFIAFNGEHAKTSCPHFF